MIQIDESFKGVISITKQGEPILRYHSGYANLTCKVLNTMETRFGTASAGKVFVALAILKLIEEKKLSFDTCIGDLLDWQNENIDLSITVRELLTHTSGIPDYFDESVMDNYDELWTDYPNYKIRTSWDLMPLFIDKPMQYKRGDHFSYNNTGYVVLGYLIEKITGKAFDSYLEEIIFNPCGMSDTGYYELDRLPTRCATHYCYDVLKDEYYSNIYSIDVKGSGAGGVFTTVGDIEQFWMHLMKGNILSQEMVGEMLNPQTVECCYGYGVWLRKQKDGNYLPYFQGSDPGVSFISSYDLKKERIVTMVSNFACDVWKIHQILELEQE